VSRDSDQLKYAFALALLYFARNLCQCLFHGFHNRTYKTKVSWQAGTVRISCTNCDLLHWLRFSLFGEETWTNVNSVSPLQHTGFTLYSTVGFYSALHALTTYRPREVDIRTTLRDAIFGQRGDKKEKKEYRRSVLGAGLSFRRYSLKIVWKEVDGFCIGKGGSQRELQVIRKVSQIVIAEYPCIVERRLFILCWVPSSFSLLNKSRTNILIFFLTQHYSHVFSSMRFVINKFNIAKW